MALPKSEGEFQLFVERFESGSIPKTEWHHAEHVAVAFWYLAHLDEEAAIAKIRQGIKNLNSKHGVPQTLDGGYHETWTVFFAKILRRHIDKESGQHYSLIERMHSSIGFLKNFREVTRQYYSRELITSWEARTSWKDPDLKSL
jgi:hypothetical protein